uniref:Uncharacterized protein n=1 Tax=Myoviridae sp. ctFCq8 TaxID=2827605 RepID=A0A8S5LIV1_9CAUD|nr:MAG TPA: hypothetical protein [Myoviridae sp. ctFCq8]DAN75659.1 MAG TPA: hypothetical protein [Caudoviricetes sp.]DAR49871.1 MAG TPA: hypothetical protein [Caudoviricetes sp.]
MCTPIGNPFRFYRGKWGYLQGAKRGYLHEI